MIAIFEDGVPECVECKGKLFGESEKIGSICNMCRQKGEAVSRLGFGVFETRKSKTGSKGFGSD